MGGLRGQNIPDGAFFLNQRVVLTNPLLRLPRALCEEQQQAEKKHGKRGEDRSRERKRSVMPELLPAISRKPHQPERYHRSNHPDDCNQDFGGVHATSTE